MTADFSKPTATSPYTSFPAEIREMFEALARLFDGTATLNMPGGTIRWNSTNKRFEIYDGTSWGPLTDQFNMNVSNLGHASPGNASGNIPVSNGDRCVNLVADKLDGLEASQFARRDISALMTSPLYVNSSSAYAELRLRSDVTQKIRANLNASMSTNTARFSVYNDAGDSYKYLEIGYDGSFAWNGTTVLTDDNSPTAAFTSGDVPRQMISLTDMTDNTFVGVVVERQLAAATNAGTLVCVNSTGQAAPADADAFATMPAIGIQCWAGAAGTVRPILVHGFFRHTAWSFTPGDILYASPVGGQTISTPPNGSGDIVQAIGVAVTSDIILVNPSLTYFEVA
ncbi:hypothetical protein [Pseudodesulfovibrio tunisiensis]|uniref:hypothetical protein n=1 Tax=Pseudodesulfovibrio tunisiensis TaxID=463192 RepID=UPI001FB1C585|nr:hypothetical protein [Pseudodesulfovibrio tunisiensis]